MHTVRVRIPEVVRYVLIYLDPTIPAYTYTVHVTLPEHFPEESSLVWQGTFRPVIPKSMWKYRFDGRARQIVRWLNDCSLQPEDITKQFLEALSLFAPERETLETKVYPLY